MSIFQNSSKSLPKKPDSQIVRVDMEEDQISGRKSHLPKGSTGTGGMTIQHVGSASGAMK